MAAWGLLASAVLGAVASASFLVVGVRLGRRTPAPEAAEAHRGFRVWWFAVSAYAFTSGLLLNLLAFADLTPVRLFVTLRTASIVALCVGVWGLGHSVTFLLTGWRHSRAAWAFFMAAVYLVVNWTFAASVATSVRTGPFETRLEWTPAPEPWLVGLSFALLTLPQTGAAVAYAFLASRIEEPAARRRAILVAAGLTAWFLAAAVALATRDSPAALARPLLGIVAAACVLLAYAPPPGARATSWRATRAERADALHARVRDLV